MAEERKPNLTTALDADGNWRHINEVATGLACNCFCPHCHARLIAVNSKPESESKAHHFAHDRGSDCVWSDESTLHKLAKEVLAEERKIMLPPVSGEASCRQLEFDEVTQESRDAETGLIPDCVCRYGDSRLWVEFKRTHEVDGKKAEKIRGAKIDCVEVDLNKCEIDKEAVRRFLVEDSSYRIWVYNSETFQQKEHYGKGKWRQTDFQERNYCVIERHLAFDEVGRIVDARSLADTARDSVFYCLNCGKSLVLRNGSFVHKVDNDRCVDDIYLLKAARELAFNSFKNNGAYGVTIPQHHVCEASKNCPFFAEEKCFTTSNDHYGLRSLGFSVCEKASRISGRQDAFDIILRRADSPEDAIAVNFSTEDCWRDPDDSLRQIDVRINDESDILSLSNGLHGDCRNFENMGGRCASPREIQTAVWKFTLYGSGRYYIGRVPCSSMNSKRSGDAVKEFLIKDNDVQWDRLGLFCLLLCHEKDLPACYCELCFHLKRNDGRKPICARYRSKNTPKFPLDSKPCNCGFFQILYSLQDSLKEEFKEVKVLESKYRVK